MLPTILTLYVYIIMSTSDPLFVIFSDNTTYWCRCQDVHYMLWIFKGRANYDRFSQVTN